MSKIITTEEEILNFKKVHGNTYDYSLVDYKSAKEKVKIICPEHGMFEQIPSAHKRGQGCPKCAKSKMGRAGMTKEEFVNRSVDIHGNKYDYSLVEFKTTHEKVKIICPEHGMWEQKVNNHIHGKKGCPKCAGNVKYTTEEFIKKAKEVHGDKYDYSLSEYGANNQTKVKIICPTHGEFEQVVSNHLFGSGCPHCYGNVKYTTESYIEAVKKVHGDKYDYSLVEYVGKEEKIKIICSIHGEFKQKASNHKYGQGCPHCKGDKIAKSKTFIDEKYLINKFKEVHGDKYDYSKFIFHGRHSDKKSIIICKVHGEFGQNPFNHLSGQGCPKCSIRFSQQEEYIENYLKKNNINYKGGDREQINPLELDFYLPDHKIAIEVNGLYWHSELRGKKRNYHLNKTNLCKEKGIKLLHINENEFVNYLPIIKSKLNSILGINKKRIHGRKCIVKEIDTPLKSKFLNKYHLQGNDKASVKLGLFYKNRLVSVMTFCKRRIAMGKKSSEEGEYELSRYCGNFHFYALGGASKLLKYFERNYNPTKIVTYADKRWSTGDLYYQLGFDHSHDSSPNYWYFKNNDMFKVYHRFNFRKDQLSKKLDKFDPNISEWNNMQINDWNRIWDCGSMVFEKNYK